ncbi:Hypothetical protein NCS54_00947400 [Fusarium falciforme]|uniref:Hypothetical protein n=1 Tax=Fusarium falciforme TaxID=195108 RepID=UPI0023018F2A|nr:Hypothetical protein NCS54_00947400 [Fusarium falciforme]WAO91987.1 Hypothetical protein NCS54_00947400 [Fusarium falciforme]
MKFSLILMPLMLLGDVVSAQSSLNDICTGSANSGCKATITVPNGFKVITTRKRFEKKNPCKTKKTITVKCGTKTNPNKTCKKTQCVKGIDVYYKNVPTSLQITYVKINVCNKIRQVLGKTLGDKFLKARDPICNCFSKLRTLNSQGKFTSSSAGNFDLGNNYYLDQAQDLQKCNTNGGLKYGHNRVATVNKLKANGWAVAFGADLELPTFRAMISVIHPCRATGVCDSNLIYAVFNNYVIASYRILLGPIIPVQNRWRDSLVGLEKSTGYVLNQTDNVAEAFYDIYSTLNNYRHYICGELNYCEGNRFHINKFMGNVDNVMSMTYSLIQASQPLAGHNAKVTSLLGDVNTLRSNWAKVPTANEMVNKIKNNEIKVAKDVFKFMPVVQEMPTTAKKVTTELGPLKSFVNQYLAGSENLHDLITSMLEIDWEKDHQEEFGNDQYGVYVRNGLISIQGNLNEALAEAVKVYFWLIRAVDSQLEDFTLTNGRWRMETGTTPYQRWTTLHMDMPCTKITKTPYKSKGLSKLSNSHRVYWKCPFGPHDTHYPMVHVPYMRMYE